LAPGRPLKRGIRRGRVISPGRYIGKDLWRNRSRSLFSISGMACLALLLVLFTSMRAGLSDYFDESGVGEPSQREKDLYMVKEVLDKWVYLIGVLSLILFALIVANTATINVLERKFELATLRAIGMSSLQVYSLLIGSILVQLVIGTAIGSSIGAALAYFLDDTAISFGGEGVGIPFRIDLTVFYMLFGVVALAGIIGSIPPLILANIGRPQEVLRNAG
jgi:putative ABC transport system permease protein